MAAEQSTTPVELNAHAAQLFYRGAASEAEQVWRHTLRLAPNYVEAHANLASAPVVYFGLLVRPVGHQAQSLVIALRSPATNKRSSDLKRYHRVSRSFLEFRLFRS